MDDSQLDARHRGSVDLVESSVLDTIIPEATDVNIEEVLAGSMEKLGSEADSPLSGIPQRRALYFDEKVTVYVVLQTPNFDERTLRSYLSRLDISLEAQAVNSQADTADGKPNFEVIHSGSVSDAEDPLIIVQGADENGSAEESRILVVWKTDIVVTKPQRLRMQSPSIVFAAAANFVSQEKLELESKTDEYMASLVPSAVNLLESFGDDPTLGPANPRLSALRVSRVVPAQLGKETTKPLKNIARKSLRVYPAVGAKVRLARPSDNAPGNLAILACLDVDVTPYVPCPVTLESIAITMPGGIVESLNDVQGLQLPLQCLPRDDITFIYRVSPDEMEVPRTNLKAVQVSLTARLHLSNIAQPLISVTFKASVDFTLPVNPGYGQPSQPIQRQHRPSQLSMGSTFDLSQVHQQTKPDSLPVVEPQSRLERTASIPDFGVTMTFRCVSERVVAGRPFVWEVFVVNRSEKSRKLALVIVPRRRRNDSRMNRASATGSYNYGRKDGSAVADAVVDDNVLHAVQRGATLDPAALVCLNSDIRIGPLAPAACHTVQAQLVALQKGIAQVEAVRIIDLGSNEHVDITDLPTVVVEPSC